MDGYEQVSYDAPTHPHPLAPQTQPPAAADLGTSADSLAALCEEFPAFRIWREVIGDRIQYVARCRAQNNHPHTVVTADPARLRAALVTGRAQPAAGSDDPATCS
jgi:hypothetical protein